MILKMMAAMLLTGHGGLDMLECPNMSTPTPEKGEVLIKVGACGVNNTDINTRKAWYSKTNKTSLGEGVESGFENFDNADGTCGSGAIQFPVIQGADAVGGIVAVGAGVSNSRIGERVIADPWLLPHGGWLNAEEAGYFGSELNGGVAEYTKVRTENAIKVTSDLSNAEVATFPCAYTTAENLVQRTAPHLGETVVISGVSGGVGSAAITLCRLRGCSVIAIVSSSKAERLLELGAAHVTDRNTADLETEIRRLDGSPVEIALDVVCCDGFMALVNALRQGGRYSTSGRIAGQFTEFDLRQLVYKDLQLTGATICPPGTMQRVVDMIETGALKPLLAETYPLKELAAAREAFIAKNTSATSW
jgi:NADPH:quinone reductase-like Zn-dependent oxidoreductase